jgi:peptidoglycan/LPS O-acetylase OafA/YrhL
MVGLWVRTGLDDDRSTTVVPFRYRAELDGLRAVAILTTMWSHAGFRGLSGSGIDFFFVISGYLATSIALRDRDLGRFGVGRYLVRRARRILPALVVVMLATLPVAVLVMLPDELENYGQSLVATLASGNNVLLWLTSGYWDLASDFKPFLHTWSLGVEEQFYLLFPLVLVVAPRVPARVRTIALVAATLASLALALHQGLVDVDSAYYLLPARAWEILVGCLLAVGARRGWRWLVAVPDGRARWLALLGLGLVVASLVGAPAEEGFRLPVVAAAVAGVALVIAFARSGSPVTRLLSARPLVAVGVVTFSVYLWHQPLFVFARVLTPEAPPAWLFVVLMAVALGVGWLSWRFVEEPFRRPARMSLRRFVPVVGGGVAVVVVAEPCSPGRAACPHGSARTRPRPRSTTTGGSARRAGSPSTGPTRRTCSWWATAGRATWPTACSRRTRGPTLSCGTCTARPSTRGSASSPRTPSSRGRRSGRAPTWCWCRSATSTSPACGASSRA